MLSMLSSMAALSACKYLKVMTDKHWQLLVVLLFKTNKISFKKDKEKALYSVQT